MQELCINFKLTLFKASDFIKIVGVEMSESIKNLSDSVDSTSIGLLSDEKYYDEFLLSQNLNMNNSYAQLNSTVTTSMIGATENYYTNFTFNNTWNKTNTNNTNISNQNLNFKWTKNRYIRKSNKNNLNDEFKLLKNLNETSNYFVELAFFELTTLSGITRLYYEECDYNLQQYFSVDGNRRHSRRAVVIVRQIFQGVKYLHQKNIFHSNLNSTHVLINHVNFQVRISGLNHAKQLSTPHEQVQCEGTLYYRAPEINRRRRASLSADLWSCACLLIFIMTGKVPFYKDLKFEEQNTIIEKELIVILGHIKIEANFDEEEDKNILIDRIYNSTHVCCEKLDIHDEQAVNLLENLLQFTPDQRISAENALTTQYFK